MNKNSLILILAMVIGLAGCGPSRADRQAAYQAKVQELAQKQAQTEADTRVQCEQRVAEAEPEWDAFRKRLKSEGYGPFPSNWQKLAKDAILPQLKDPGSAQFRFNEKPSGTYTVVSKESNASEDKFWHQCWKLISKSVSKPPKEYITHWTVKVGVNAKNSYGGYVGHETWQIDIRDGIVVNASNETARKREIDNIIRGKY